MGREMEKDDLVCYFKVLQALTHHNKNDSTLN
jgi:hypothetical protein